jgi:hypothetical protein
MSNLFLVAKNVRCFELPVTASTKMQGLKVPVSLSLSLSNWRQRDLRRAVWDAILAYVHMPTGMRSQNSNSAKHC